MHEIQQFSEALEDQIYEIQKPTLSTTSKNVLHKKYTSVPTESFNSTGAAKQSMTAKRTPFQTQD